MTGMANRLIVSYADGKYVPGQRRLIASCETLGLPIRCYGESHRFTPQSDFPYYFKIDCLLDAAQQASTLLWADSSVLATGKGSANPIFDHIEQHGYLLECEDWTNAQWCNDASLQAFGFTRDEATRQRQVRGFFWGVSMHHPTGKLLIDEMIAYKPFFKGRHVNVDGSESQDPRCLGHRHDQSILTLLVAKHGLAVPYWNEHPWCFYGT